MSEENKEVIEQEVTEKVEEVEDKKEEVVEKLHEETVEKLEELREEGNDENEKVIDDARKSLDKIFKDLKNWTKENSDPEKIKATFGKAKDDVSKVLENARKKAVEVSNSDNFKKTIDSSKDFLEGAGGLIADGFKATADFLMQNDKVNEFVGKADEKLNTLRDSEGLKRGVDAAEELSNKVNSAIFGGLKNFFDKDKENEE